MGRFIKLAFFLLHVVSATAATNCVSDSVGEPVCDTEQDRTTLLQNRLLIEEKETNEAPWEEHPEGEEKGNGEKHKQFGQGFVEGFGSQAGWGLPHGEHPEGEKKGNGEKQKQFGQGFVEGFRSQAGSIKQGWRLPHGEHPEGEEKGNGEKQKQFGQGSVEGFGSQAGSIKQGWILPHGEGLPARR